MTISEVPEPVDLASTPMPAPAPAPAPRASSRSAFIGALVGMAALAATVVGVSAVAGARGGDEPAAVSAPSTDEGTTDGPMVVTDLDDSGFHDPAFDAFDACLADELGDAWTESPGVPGPRIDESAFADAEAGCSEFLPDEVLADMEMWEAFDDCLREQGVADDVPIGFSSVHIETVDGFQIAEFGDTEGSITISGTEGALTVESTGGVTILDESALEAQWEALDAAHQACEQLLPEDMQFDGGFGVEIFEGDFPTE